jgi:hypothetical protein
MTKQEVAMRVMESWRVAHPKVVALWKLDMLQVEADAMAGMILAEAKANTFPGGRIDAQVSDAMGLMLRAAPAMPTRRQRKAV